MWEREAFDDDLAVPHVPIYWFVSGHDSATFEAAPGFRGYDERRDFTTYYSRPEH